MKRIPLRSRIRAVSTTLFLLLFPAIFYYLSPVIPIGGSVEGIVTGSLLVFVSLFLLATVLGRSFCAYVCPGGTLQDHVAAGRARRFPRRGFSWIKYVIWAVWLGMLVFFFRRAGGVQGVRFAFETENGLSVTDMSSLIAYLMVVMVFFGLSLAFGRRAACHTICWMAPFMILGRKLGLAAGIPSLRVSSAPQSCVGCGICDDACPMSLEVSRLQAKGSIASVDCILCGKCVDACPKKTLSFAWR
jgi:polyferredoxin